MRKTFLLLPLMLIPAFGQNNGMKRGADNDSPIVVSDSSTRPLPKTKGSQTTAKREFPRGNQYFKQAAQKKATVHDKDAGPGEKYRPACLTFMSNTPPIVFPAAASSWKIDYVEGTNEVPLMHWEASTGDITLEGFTVNATYATADLSLLNKKLNVTIDDVAHPVSVGGSKQVLKVHYCPDGVCHYCQNPDANGNCRSPIDPCK
jgi:hypothetical protein